MDLKWTRWVNPNRVKKARYSRELAFNNWDPLINDYLSRAAENINHDENYYIGFVGDGENNTLINCFNRKEQELSKCTSAFVLKGSIGIGKTSFLKWWNKQPDRRHVSARVDLMHEGPKWLTDKQRPVLWCMQMFFCNRLRISLSRNITGFKKEFDEKVLFIQKQAYGIDDKDFQSGFVNQSDTFQSNYGDYNSSVLLTCIIAAANKVCTKPVWISVDNVDLESPDEQHTFIRYAFTCKPPFFSTSLN